MNGDPQNDSLGAANGEAASPLSQELANWSVEFRTRWFRSDKGPKLSINGRRALAAFGAFVYLCFAAWTAVSTDDLLESTVKSGYMVRNSVVFGLGGVLILSVAALFLGRLVVVHDDDGGPVRTFLGGVALPAVVVLIAKVSLWIF